jgi:anaerobic ribonucleoside-triphosphate reductase activating protein
MSAGATQIGLSRLHFPVTTLGPGRRIGIWFQGCSIRCPGCVSADTWGFDRGLTSVSDVVAAIKPWLTEADGVTISGGEPFDQPEALIRLLHEMPLNDAQDVLVYSGHPFEKLSAPLAQAEGLIDALISDPFDFAEGQTKVLRGSDNQRMHLLTDKGRARFRGTDRSITPADRSLDVMFDGDGTVWLAGIPRTGDMKRLQQLLQDQGHHALTTQSTKGLTLWE